MNNATPIVKAEHDMAVYVVIDHRPRPDGRAVP